MRESHPTDADLALLWPATLHTRWLRSGVAGGIGAKPDAPPCVCEQCLQSRRKRWLKEAASNAKP